MNYKLLCGNSLDELKKIDDNSIDSIVTDPPYELGFMGKQWDSTGIAFNKELWKETLRVLKPGGHLIAFSGSRTYHRMAVAIEDAGFEIRDQILWIYGSGFPKALDISKAIDNHFDSITAPSTPQANQWDGWKTALKPAHEPMVLARKPMSEKTVAENILKWGTGGLNIDGCRVGGDGGTKKINTENCRESLGKYGDGLNGGTVQSVDGLGRFPANLIHDGSEEVVSLFPESKSGKGKANTYDKNGGQWGKGKQIRNADYGDEGSAARFFYCAKASKKDRNEGLGEFEEKPKKSFNTREESDGVKKGIGADRKTVAANGHPTVKPTDLMAYLVRLVTPPNGTVLDPFNGSGSTGKACMRDGFKYIGIDLSQEYLDISKARIEHELSKKKQTTPSNR